MKYLLTILFALVLVVASAQQPIITNLGKTSGTVNETIQITGSGFPTNLADVQVNFGPGIATVNSTSASLIEVLVPATATYSSVTVLNKSNGLSGSSRKKFLLSFGGSGFDAAQVDAQQITPTNNTQTFDLCTCDFDGDGKIDVGMSNNDADNINLLRNTSTLTTTSFVSTNIPTGNRTLNTDCGDLNGDGKPDLVFSNNVASASQDIFVIRNTSSVGSITGVTDFSTKIPPNGANNRQARAISIVDVDGDGKNDVLVGNDTDGSLIVYLNTTASVGGVITFATPTVLTISGITNTSSIDVADLNNDGIKDIVTTIFDQFGQGSSDVFVLKNISTVGNPSFAPPIGLGIDASGVDIITADFDMDEKLDIVVTDRADNKVFIIPNTSTGGSLSFGSAITKSLVFPFGASAADLNGDGLPDLCVGSSAASGNKLSIYPNNSTVGSINFETEVAFNTASNIQYISTVDFNGDAKPDFGYVHKSQGGVLGELGVSINRNCFVPEISPADLTFCLNNPFTLSTIKTVEASYTWDIVSGTGTVTPSGNEASFEITAGSSATVSVTITANDGSCNGTSQNTFEQVLTISAGSPPTLPAITSSSPICAGDDLTVSGPAGFTNYYWTTPDGREITETDNELVITNVSAANAGTYTLRVQGAECVSNPGTTDVIINENPPATVNNLGTDNFCSTGTTTLQVPSYTGFTYSWLNASDVEVSTTNSLTTGTSGNYRVELTNTGTGCVSTGEPYTITAVTPPTSAFDAIAEICEGVPVDFTATSTGQSGFTLSYEWDFGDGSSTSTGSQVSHTYNAAASNNVVLTTSYAGVDACTTTSQQTINVTATPSAADIEALITPSASAREKCPEDVLAVSLPTGYLSYEWLTDGNIVGTTNTVDAATARGVDDVTLTANVTTDLGCEVTGITATISNFANSQITITSTDGLIQNDTIILEEGIASVTLEANNGSAYDWTPAQIISDPSAASVTAMPISRYTTVSVTGTDNINGCVTTATVVLETPGVIARNSFSPNGDGLGFDCWEILNTETLQGCKVFIMDERGRYVYTANSPFENNCVWNGNIDGGGAPAPEGIYYFILKCGNDEFSQTGSILLAR